MSWTTDKKILTDSLTGYAEIQGNLKPDEAGNTRSHKCYVVTLGKPDTTQMTNNATIEVRLVKLEMNYRQKNVSEYDSNCEDFETLTSTIENLSPFVSFATITPPARFDNKAQNTTAILEFYFGVRTY